MAKRHRDEIILARWTVDAASLCEFTGEARLRYGDSPYAPNELLKECEKHSAVGIEVVFRDDACFVGDWCFTRFPECRVHEIWMQFLDKEECYDIQLPLARGATAQAERIAGHYNWMGQEAVRRAAEERAKPTWNNYMLTLVEAHFIWVMLGFFFIVIPLFILIPGLLRGSLWE